MLGVVELKDIVKGGIRERFAELRRMGIKTVMITGDNPLTAAAIAAEAGVDDFLAEATPEAKLKLIREQQAGGRLVAMTGDGTNDAPALAQADVAVAMNTGTQAAKEAGNMVDLDSNPTKLIEVVRIGKQLLMTHSALTTFSIANDVSKYFAIIPAAFAGTYSVLGAFEHHATGHAGKPLFFGRNLQCVDYRCPDPVGPARRRVPAGGSGGHPAAEPVGVRRGRADCAVSRHQTDRYASRRTRTRMTAQLRPALVLLGLFTLLTGAMYPAFVTVVAQAVFPNQANGSLLPSNGPAASSELPAGSALIGQPFNDPKYFWSRPSATGPVPYNAAASSGSNLGPTNPALMTAIEERVAALRKSGVDPQQPVPWISSRRPPAASIRTFRRPPPIFRQAGWHAFEVLIRTRSTNW